MNAIWNKALKSSADAPQARHYFDQLDAAAAATLKQFSAADAAVVAALFSGSRAASELLIANPDWLMWLRADRLKQPRKKQGFLAEWNRLCKAPLGTRGYEAALQALRCFKQREMTRIAARDLAGFSHAVEITRELSDLADVCLSAVWDICLQQLINRFGRPYHQEAAGSWAPTEACVLGMGKLGGQELNYSSDVDVLFVYSAEGQVFKEPPDGSKAGSSIQTNHQYFNRLAESYIAEVTRMTPDGMLFRMDLRLRPEGDAGPLCRSLDSYENYYAQWGQTWERMMLIKARGVAGSDSLAEEFLEMIQPFRFPRLIGDGVLQEVAATKVRIENEVLRADEIERNVKLGRGGIREIEFIAQSQQLLLAGRQPFLQLSQTLPALDKLVQYGALEKADSARLREAYCFLRDVEHRLQMDENLQTHTIPKSKPAQVRLARLMGFDTQAAFEAARQRHCDNVRAVYDRILTTGKGEPQSPFPTSFEGTEREWEDLLARHSFRDPVKAARLLRGFVEGPGYVHVSPRTIELARHLLSRLLGLCRQKESKSGDMLPPKTLSDPDRVLARLDSFITAYGTRAALYELWNSNPLCFELLVLLFDRSEFLAEVVIRSPELVDEIVVGERLRQRKTAAEIFADLMHGRKDADQFAWLRRYHEAEALRIGLREILGLADYEQNMEELAALADACLQYALGVTLRKHRQKQPPFVIVGLGKLGGQEINYGSDLDIVFVAPDKVKNLPALQKLAVEVMDLLSRRTERGIVFETDARLRPDGEKSLLVNTIAAYEEYYLQRAQLWEIQSLTRTRPLAGDLQLGKRFQTLVARLTDFSTAGGRKKRAALTMPECYTADWKHTIHAMRMRIEKERTPAGKDELAIKTGCGGLMDAEFIAQALSLAQGWQEANTLRALQKSRAHGVLPEAEKLIQNYAQLRRLECVLRRWSYEGETVLPDDPEPFRRVSVRCGFGSPDAFRKALSRWRQSIREVYLKYFEAQGVSHQD